MSAHTPTAPKSGSSATGGAGRPPVFFNQPERLSMHAEQRADMSMTRGGAIGHGTCATEAGYVGNAAAVNQCSPQFDRTVSVTVEVKAVRNFADALMHVMSGKRITRAGWNAGGQHVKAQFPDKLSTMPVPYLVLKNSQNEFVPWVPSQGDLFANDWALLPN